MTGRPGFKPLLAAALAGLALHAQAFVLLSETTSYFDGQVAPDEFVFKWGEAHLGTPGGVVTYSFMSAGTSCEEARRIGDPIPRNGFCATRDLAAVNAGFQRIVESAFAQWEQWADIDFVEVSDVNPATQGNIRIGAVGFNTFNVLGLSYIGPVSHARDLGADIYLNANFRFSENDLADTVLHEIGHSLGLGHSFASDSVMRAGAGNLPDTLQADDIAGVQTIYGARLAVPEPATPALLGLAAVIGLRRSRQARPGSRPQP